MKKLIPFIILLLGSVPLFAQRFCSGAKIHSFKRSSIPGMIQGPDIRDDGKVINKPVRPVINYFIYMELPSAKTVIDRVWIDGKAYRTSIDTIASTPVTVSGGQVGKFETRDTVVPKTRKAVVRLNIHEQEEISPADKIRGQLDGSAVLVEFHVGRKKYFTRSGEWKKLPSVVLQ